MGFSNSSLITNTQENEEELKILKTYREEMGKIQKEFDVIEDIVDVLPFIQQLKEEILILKMKLASAHENADIQKHNEVAGVIIEVNDRLKEQLGLLEKVKKIYGEENNNWEDDEFFLDACKQREEVFDKYHHGTLVEQEELEAETKQRYEDNEKARQVIQETCNENKELKDEIEFSRCANKKAVLKNKELKEENEHLDRECDRLSELEVIAWTDFYGEKEVIDDIKCYIFRRDIIKMKEDNKKLKAKADCFTALVYGIGWETLHELCDDTTTARLIESGEFVPEDFA